MRNVFLLAVAASLSLPMDAGAQESAYPRFHFSGYGTVGAMHSSNDRADYLVDAFKPNGPGHTHKWSFDSDSRLGLQLSADFSPSFSAVLQVLAQQQHDGTYGPIIEWFNVKYQATPDLSLRAGRVVLPLFMVTDTRRVGFANPWIRPPVEVYSLVPVTRNDGLDASYRSNFGGWTNTLQVTAGGSDSRFPNASGFDAGTSELRKLVAVANTIERGPSTVRLSYGKARLSITAFEPFADALEAFGPPGEELADRYGVEDGRTTFVGVGASHDTGAWFATAEWARFDARSILGAKSAWYVGGGLRLGKFTPYATFARLRAASNISDPGIPLAGLPPEVAEVAAALNARLNEQLALLPVQDTVSAGFRWDFARNAALKVQFDQVKLGAQSRGTFGNVQPGFQPGSRVRLIGLAVDFVF